MSPDKISLKKGALAVRLAQMIERGGPIPLSLFMGLANTHYYATRDPLGVDGDFTTAPEISQMFGELIGLWCADLALRSGQTDVCTLVELGPGRGTLMADVLRAMHQFGVTPDVHLVETSPVLRDLQAAAVPHAQFHDDVSTLPAGRPLIIIANEFFDALPVRQLVQTHRGWRERMVGLAETGFSFTPGEVPMDGAVPMALRTAPLGKVIESSAPSLAIAADLASALARHGGAMVIIDYGHVGVSLGDTLQAVSRHHYTGVLDEPGERDLTAHVDFGALAEVGREAGLGVHGLVEQGAFLRALGLDARCESLMAGHPDRAVALAAERDRLAGDDQMGQLFKVLACVAPGWPTPEGFAA